jgi:hypothetical protein
MVDFMLRQQKHLPRSTAQHILLGSFPECDVVSCIGAEDHHIGKVSSVFLNFFFWWSGGFSEGAAGREDCFDGLDDDPC